ncbi:hypothetical protein Tco_0168166 [Tanacetum coccineum]
MHIRNEKGWKCVGEMVRSREKCRERNGKVLKCWNREKCMVEIGLQKVSYSRKIFEFLLICIHTRNVSQIFFGSLSMNLEYVVVREGNSYYLLMTTVSALNFDNLIKVKVVDASRHTQYTLEKMMNVTAADVFLSLFKWAKRQTWYKACDEVYSLNECHDFDKHMLMADSGEFVVEAELDQEGKLSMLFIEFRGGWMMTFEDNLFELKIDVDEDLSNLAMCDLQTFGAQCAHLLSLKGVTFVVAWHGTRIDDFSVLKKYQQVQRKSYVKGKIEDCFIHGRSDLKRSCLKIKAIVDNLGIGYCCFVIIK